MHYYDGGKVHEKMMTEASALICLLLATGVGGGGDFTVVKSCKSNYFSTSSEFNGCIKTFYI